MKHVKPRTLEVKDELVEENQYVACNISQFKCKPTNGNVPGQFLVNFTPPVCLSNYLFSDLEIFAENKAYLISEIESKNYAYINTLKLSEIDTKQTACKQIVNWKFTDSEGNFYLTDDIPLFNAAK